ncbi:hypothetical protein CHGG_08502 [Chaetomium globosum CBS 148.51]|uniref:Uncharacterized protein n=1 Tax=Chaetomium globosum (strain ATCC 6205 / CBS 148.51 / DSM 1962 / NBRC 6347 / NRRL 1970) TaxID=306901 RepID=Q2GU52_CHAGB|nr:uncharacterized protein CHGG_08502 [Chaetomium globosum CBS 148.51]EAQ84488.1 hypothetical protein CHGG_08502 [Chaetomium globosum CBS 148.51]
MSVGFGFSVGDFLAALHLVGTVIDALREASDSGAAYRELLTELFALETALLHVKRLDLDDGQRTEKIALRQAAAHCQRTIDKFWDKIQKYQPHLQEGGTGSRIKDSWIKIKWAVCKKDDVEQFKADLRGHTGSIQVLLLAVQMEATTMQSRRQNERQNTLAGRIQESSVQWLSKLSVITDGVNHSVQQGKALLDATAKIIQTNLRVFQMIFDIHQYILQVPSQINRQQPVYMIDAFGKESPFHLEFVRSAEAFMAILKVNFKSNGSQKIERGEFVIEDDGTKRDVDLTSDWGTCFFPGQRVSMSMVFKSLKNATTSTCPSCGTESGSAPDREVVWYVQAHQLGIIEPVDLPGSSEKCGVTFRRVREESDEMPPPLHQTTLSEKVQSPDRLPGVGPQPPKRKSEAEGVDDVRGFRRVRLLDSGTRCKIYFWMGNEWRGRGTGYGEVRLVGLTATNLDTILAWMSVYSGTLQALRFQTVEGCRAVWNQLPSQGRVTARNSWRANTKRRPKLGIDPQADRQLGHESQEDPDEDARRNSETIMRRNISLVVEFPS